MTAVLLRCCEAKSSPQDDNFCVVPSEMTWIKICGMTNLEDALSAVEAGADAVGFVFYEKSPRNISVEAAREIVGKLPENVEKIGVFVPGEEFDPMDVLRHAELTGIQTYISEEGERSADRKRQLEFHVFRSGRDS